MALNPSTLHEKGVCHEKSVSHLKKLALVRRSVVSGEEVEEHHVDLATLPSAGSAGWCSSVQCLPQFWEFFGKRAGKEQMELLPMVMWPMS